MMKRLVILFTIVLAVSFAGCGPAKQAKENIKPQPQPQPHSQSLPYPPSPPMVNDTEMQPAENMRRPLPKPFMPTELIIPAIKVKASVEPVGVLEDGQMDVPKHTDIVGVLHPGVLAGEPGNMVMDGHVDSYTGPAIFFNLKKLKPGDSIIVRDHAKQKLTYIVEAVESYPTSEAPVERVFGDTTEHRLNLVTCSGKYSRKKKEHEQRLIVFAKLDGDDELDQ